MKTLKIIPALLFCSLLLFSFTSCVVLVKKDNGHHKGWFKNRNNPHHPASTNPGHNKGKSNKKHK